MIKESGVLFGMPLFFLCPYVGMAVGGYVVIFLTACLGISLCNIYVAVKNQ